MRQWTTTRLVAAVVLPVLAATAGCGVGDGGRRQQPTQHPVEQEVITAYREFYVALERAYAKPQQAHTILSDVATPPQLDVSVGSITAWQQAGQRASGRPVLRNPRIAELTDQRAVVIDCQDTSRVRRTDTMQRHVFSQGARQESVQTTLIKVHRAWLVTTTSFPPQREVFCQADERRER